ncbi:MAG: hypothetical protein N2747_05320 [Chitinophagaceae bacterium]|nr:hypothetical protein [Chitinophagaceae bacterium]
MEQRPKIVSKHERIGDFEVGLMVGRDHKGAILVKTDRAILKTRF